MHRVDKQEIIANLTGVIEHFLDNVAPGFEVKDHNAVMQDVFVKTSGYWRLTVDILIEPKPEDSNE